MLLSFNLTEAGIGDEYFYEAPPPVFLLRAAGEYILNKS